MGDIAGIDQLEGEISNPEDQMYRGRKKTVAKREKKKQKKQDDRSKREQIGGISLYQQRGRHEKEEDMKVNKFSF